MLSVYKLIKFVFRHLIPEGFRYPAARATVECFREPDAFLGYIAGSLTMGQLLCLPMAALGAFLIYKAHVPRRPA